MQQYMLSVVHDSVEGLAQLTETDMQETFAAVDAFTAKLQTRARGCSPAD